MRPDWSKLGVRTAACAAACRRIFGGLRPKRNRRRVIRTEQREQRPAVSRVFAARGKNEPP